MTTNSIPEIENNSQVYVVVLVDNDDGASFYQYVRATTGFTAALYALKFDFEGQPRTIGTYTCSMVLSLSAVLEIGRDMENFKAPDVGHVDRDEEIDDFIIPIETYISP